MTCPRFTLVLAALVLLCAPVAASAQQNFAFVDSIRAAANSKEGKAAQERLKNMTEKKREEFRPKEEKLKRMQEEFETQRFVLSKDALQERELDILKGKRNFERDLQEAQEEFEIEQRKLMQPILKSVLDAVSNVARDKGYSVVLEKASPGVLFYSDDLDITDQVIERLNEG